VLVFEPEEWPPS